MTPHFTYTSPPESGTPLHVTLAGWNSPSAAAEIRRDRSMDLFVFQYIEKGRGFLEVEGRRHALKAGDVMLTCAGSLHRYGPDPKDPWQKSWFNLQGNLTSNLLRVYHLGGMNHFPGNETAGKIIRQTVEELATLSREQADDYVSVQVLRIILALKDQTDQKNAGPCHPAASRLHRFLHGFIRKAPPSLATMSAHVSLSPTHLIRIFRKAYGMTPYAFLLSEKINVAADMLTNSGVSIGEISDFLGFTNEFYFSRIFKKKKGIAPGAFRKANHSRPAMFSPSKP